MCASHKSYAGTTGKAFNISRQFEIDGQHSKLVETIGDDDYKVERSVIVPIQQQKPPKPKLSLSERKNTVEQDAFNTFKQEVGGRRSVSPQSPDKRKLRRISLAEEKLRDEQHQAAQRARDALKDLRDFGNITLSDVESGDDSFGPRELSSLDDQDRAASDAVFSDYFEPIDDYDNPDFFRRKDFLSLSDIEVDLSDEGPSAKTKRSKKIPKYSRLPLKSKLRPPSSKFGAEGMKNSMKLKGSTAPILQKQAIAQPSPSKQAPSKALSSRIPSSQISQKTLPARQSEARGPTSKLAKMGKSGIKPPQVSRQKQVTGERSFHETADQSASPPHGTVSSPKARSTGMPGFSSVGAAGKIPYFQAPRPPPVKQESERQSMANKKDTSARKSTQPLDSIKAHFNKTAIQKSQSVDPRVQQLLKSQTQPGPEHPTGKDSNKIRAKLKEDYERVKALKDQAKELVDNAARSSFIASAKKSFSKATRPSKLAMSKSMLASTMKKSLAKQVSDYDKALLNEKALEKFETEKELAERTIHDEDKLEKELSLLEDEYKSKRHFIDNMDKYKDAIEENFEKDVQIAQDSIKDPDILKEHLAFLRDESNNKIAYIDEAAGMPRKSIFRSQNAEVKEKIDTIVSKMASPKSRKSLSASQPLAKVSMIKTSGLPQLSRTSGLPKTSRASGLPQPSRTSDLQHQSRTIGSPQASRPTDLPQHQRTSGLPHPSRTTGLPQPQRVSGMPSTSRTGDLPQLQRTSGLPQPQSRTTGLPQPQRTSGLPQPSRVSGLPQHAGTRHSEAHRSMKAPMKSLASQKAAQELSLLERQKKAEDKFLQGTQTIEGLYKNDPKMLEAYRELAKGEYQARLAHLKEEATKQKLQISQLPRKTATGLPVRTSGLPKSRQTTGHLPKAIQPSKQKRPTSTAVMAAAPRATLQFPNLSTISSIDSISPPPTPPDYSLDASLPTPTTPRRSVGSPSTPRRLLDEIPKLLKKKSVAPLRSPQKDRSIEPRQSDGPPKIRKTRLRGRSVEEAESKTLEAATQTWKMTRVMCSIKKKKKLIEASLNELVKKGATHNEILKAFEGGEKPEVPISKSNLYPMAQYMGLEPGQQVEKVLDITCMRTGALQQKLENLPPTVAESMQQKDQSFAQSPLATEEAEGIFKMMMHQSEGVDLSKDPNEITGLIIPSHGPKLSIAGLAVESPSKGVIPDQVPLREINELSMRDAEQFASTIKQQPPHKFPQESIAVKLLPEESITVPPITEPKTRDDYIQHDLVLHSFQVENYFQARGSTFPKWFPGIYSVFPEENPKLILKKTPSEVLLRAWQIMKPKI